LKGVKIMGVIPSVSWEKMAEEVVVEVVENKEETEEEEVK